MNWKVLIWLGVGLVLLLYGTVAVFAKEIIPERTGRLGYSVRVSPNHYDDPITRPCTSLLKWGG